MHYIVPAAITVTLHLRTGEHDVDFQFILIPILVSTCLCREPLLPGLALSLTSLNNTGLSSHWKQMIPDRLLHAEVCTVATLRVLIQLRDTGKSLFKMSTGIRLSRKTLFPGLRCLEYLGMKIVHG
jgi:hypothetical protein